MCSIYHRSALAIFSALLSTFAIAEERLHPYFGDYLFLTAEKTNIPHWSNGVTIQYLTSAPSEQISDYFVEHFVGFNAYASASNTKVSRISSMNGTKYYGTEISKIPLTNIPNYLVMFADDYNEAKIDVEKTVKTFSNGSDNLNSHIEKAAHTVPVFLDGKCQLQMSVDNNNDILAGILLIDKSVSQMEFNKCLFYSRLASFELKNETTTYTLLNDYELKLSDSIEPLNRLWAGRVCREKFNDRSVGCVVDLLSLVWQQKFEG